MLSISVTKSPKLAEKVEHYTPKSLLGQSVISALPFLPEELALEVLDRLQSTVVIESSLRVRAIRTRESQFIEPEAYYNERLGLWLYDYGIVSRKVVTTAFVGFLVDAMQNSTEMEGFTFHALGTGNTAAAVGDIDMDAELTTEYEVDNTRATGTQAEGATANIYQSVGTNTLNSGTPAVVEHGLLNDADVGQGILLDRHVFAAINLDGGAGDGLQSTYELTVSAGG